MSHFLQRVSARACLFAAYIADMTISPPKGTPRTHFLVVSCTAACLACAVGALSLPMLVLPVSIVSGLAFGACWALLPSMAADLFGVAHLASNYCLLQLAPACGSIAFATLLAGQLYKARVVVVAVPIDVSSVVDGGFAGVWAGARGPGGNVCGAVVLWCGAGDCCGGVCGGFGGSGGARSALQWVVQARA